MSVTLTTHAQRAGQSEAQRHPCELQTTCQPPSSWAKDPWPAIIRTLGTCGLSLALERRFEKGSGLAIELPGEDGITSTILARVVQVKPDGQGWLLEVAFISELSEEEVGQALTLSTHRQANPEEEIRPADKATLSGVLFIARMPSGFMLRWFVRQLGHEGQWPLKGGKVMSLRVPPLSVPLGLRVKRCRLFGSYWVVVCDLARMPTDEELAVLNGPNVLP